jgi:ankyrin repeat protein
MILNHFNIKKFILTGLAKPSHWACVLLLVLMSVWQAPMAQAQSYEQFFRAIEQDDAGTVDTLLKRGFDPNTPSSTLQPALTLALQNGALRVAEVLIASPNIRVNQLNPSGETPLMMAALKGQLRIGEQLLARGAELNLGGWTPLHYAATGGHAEMLKWLLQQKAPINAASPNGTTPLMMAAHYGNPEVTKILLLAGADPKLKNQLGLTALDFALNGPHIESAQLISQALKSSPGH